MEELRIVYVIVSVLYLHNNISGDTTKMTKESFLLNKK